MKVYSIGREVGCDIVINDSTDVISRRHATLNVTSSGKMTIIDQSHNGTYVNGIRISPNVPVPVTRKDNVSFAHVARLDWNMVPKTTSPMMYVAAALVAVALVVGGVMGYNHFAANGGDEVAAADSTAILKQGVDDAKAALKTKISEATGLKSAITNTAVADTLGAAIKVAQDVYDNATVTKDSVIVATDNLQKAIDVAQKKHKAPAKPAATDKKTSQKENANKKAEADKKKAEADKKAEAEKKKAEEEKKKAEEEKKKTGGRNKY